MDICDTVTAQFLLVYLKLRMPLDMCPSGLKPGRVIRVIRVTFSPGHPGLTRFIKYPGLTRIDCTIRVFRSFGAWITHS